MSLRIEHVITVNVATVELGSSLKDAVELMITHEIGCIIILRKRKTHRDHK